MTRTRVRASADDDRRSCSVGRRTHSRTHSRAHSRARSRPARTPTRTATRPRPPDTKSRCRRRPPPSQPRRCAVGQIMRRGYRTQKGTRVPPACIRSHGAGPGKRRDWQRRQIQQLQRRLATRGRTLPRDPRTMIVLKKGGLSEHGYRAVQTLTVRQRRGLSRRVCRYGGP